MAVRPILSNFRKLESRGYAQFLSDRDFCESEGRRLHEEGEVNCRKAFDRWVLEGSFRVPYPEYFFENFLTGWNSAVPESDLLSTNF